MMALTGMDLIRSHRGMALRIAEALGIHRSAVSRWAQVPAELVPAVEKASGLARHMIRPDLWDAPGRKGRKAT